MRTIKQFAALAVAFALALAIPASNLVAQDASYVTVQYSDSKGLLKAQSGGSAVFNTRTRVAIASVNAGATLLPALTGYKYRLIDASYIAIGGAVGTCTTVDILGTQSTSSVKLVAAAIAALTQNTLLRAGATNATILTGGVSFVQNDVSTAITIGKTGGSCDTATSVDVNLTYAIE